MARGRSNLRGVECETETPTQDLLERMYAKVKHKTKTHSKTELERRRRRAAALKRYDQSPRGRYKQQKRNARVRGVPWELTYEQWADIWIRSGKWDRRGNWAEGYVMMRPGDKGAYAVGNVVIGRHEDNAIERNRLAKERRERALLERPAEWYEAEAEGVEPEPEDPYDETPF